MRKTSAALAAMIWVLATACSHPTEPTPIQIAPPTDPPAIACPAPVNAVSLDGQPVAVTYPAPTVVGGAIPVTTTCTSPSGSSFPVGTTEVSCTARDNEQRQAACSFAVTVAQAPHLTVTRFLAFGDSITEGTDDALCLTAPSLTGRFGLSGGFSGLGFTPYPTLLRDMLAARYPAEMPTMTNAGSGGETAKEGDARLRSYLANQPQVVLLLEGINDIHDSIPQSDGVSDIGDGIRSMVRHIKEANAQPLVATLLPERREACKAYDFFDGIDDISDANFEIVAAAAQEGATVVDLHKAFSGQEATLLGQDGLHPSQAGYQKIADLFLEAIASKFEQH